MSERSLRAERMTKQDKLRLVEKQKAAQSRAVNAAGKPGRSERPARHVEGGKGKELRFASVPPVAGKPAFGATVSRRASDRIRNGHVWVYASDVENIATSNSGRTDGSPSLLPVADNRGVLLGTALYSPTSQIALRMVSREAIGEQQWLQVLESRLRRSIERRIQLLKSHDAATDSCRLVFSEADELPGLIADKYGDLVIFQLLAKGLDVGRGARGGRSCVPRTVVSRRHF